MLSIEGLEEIVVMAIPFVIILFSVVLLLGLTVLIRPDWYKSATQQESTHTVDDTPQPRIMEEALAI